MPELVCDTSVFQYLHQLSLLHILPLLGRVSDMGPGETQVLLVAMENEGWIAVLDDGFARRRAALLGIAFTGTLGLLLDAKRLGHIPAIRPCLDRLEELGFRSSRLTRNLILEKAGESRAA